MNKKKVLSNNIKVAGFFRMKIMDHDQQTGKTKIIGDSGWRKNLVTNLGFQYYLISPAAALTGSSQVSYFALGTGTFPAVTDTSLNGELTDATNCRFTMTPSVVSSKTLQMVGTLASSIITANRTIQNVGVYAVSSVTGGSMMCGNTYATSQYRLDSLVTMKQELREFGETPFGTIPSRALNKIKEGVETMYEATKKLVEDIVRTTWQHVESYGNAMTFSFLAKITNLQLQTNQSVNVQEERHLLETVKRKFREFGGSLSDETIPSRALTIVKEGVQTMYGITLWVKDIVGTTWQHVELGRNDSTLAI